MQEEFDMVTWIYQRELLIKFAFGSIVLILDILGIYCIVGLNAYDVAVKYLANGMEHLETLQLSLGILFLVMMANLAFVSTYLMKLYFKS
ncbi:hypothetical protein [Flavobacterium psychrotrophum]|uniref:hypothetical protein n=1 Tax=Flavobacterium psychrotrophum TaxID=2294119 RepID=UPI0013C45F62|nr:hypothetical protein [Flavobacterium psychrotrophum]